jgi:hypothetical protein
MFQTFVEIGRHDEKAPVAPVFSGNVGEELRCEVLGDSASVLGAYWTAPRYLGAR